MEIFYRSFSQLAPIRFSEKDLEEVASVKKILKRKSDIERILNIIALSCNATPDVAENEMDLYVLVRGYDRENKEREWKASPFNFYDSTIGKVCTLREEDREKLSVMIDAMKGN